MLTRTTIAEATLTDEECEGLRHLVIEVQADPYTDNSADYDTVLVDGLPWVPERLRALAVNFGNRLGAAGVLRVRRLPLPVNLPPTPDSFNAGLRAHSGAETILLGLATLAGSVIGFAGWRSGHRVHNIFPLAEDADTQKASNAVQLEMHTEAAFFLGSPEAITLLCLRNAGDRAPATAFCDLHKAWDGLSVGEQALLTEPAFFTVGRDRNGNEVRSGTIAMAYPFGGAPAAGRSGRFQYATVLRGATADHDEALRRFNAGIEATTTEVTMVPGDLVFIDNTHVVHGRTRFAPRFDGTDRWLQRCLLRQREAVPD